MMLFTVLIIFIYANVGNTDKKTKYLFIFNIYKLFVKQFVIC